MLLWFPFEFSPHHKLSDPHRQVGGEGGLPRALFPQRWLVAVLTAPKDTRRGKILIILVFHHHALVKVTQDP